MGITIPLSHPSHPFYTGTATNPIPVAKFPVSIGGHPYLIDVPKYKRATIDIMRPPQDASDEPGEQSYTNVGIWRKHETNWWGGAGQKWYDETGSAGGNPSNRECYFVSKGIDPWTQNTVKLLPRTALKKASTNTGMQLFAAGGYMYLADGTGFSYTDNIEDMNLLADNDASFETSTAGWAAIFASATLSSQTTVALDGTHSMRMTAAGSSAMKAQTAAAHRPAVTAGHTYTFTVDVRCDAASTPVNTNVSIDWKDASDAFVSTSTGIAGLDATASWLQISVTGVAPVSGFASPAISVSSTATGQQHFADRARFKRGTSVAWTLPWRLIGSSVLPVTSITSDGNSIYVARGTDGIDANVIGSTTVTNFSTGTAQLVGYANGFMFAGQANVLSSVDESGTATTYYTHRNAGFVWNGITAAPNGIYVTGNVNDHGEVYYIGIDSTAGTPLPPVYAGDIPFGESVNTLCYYRGFMFVGTSQGVRMAQVGTSNGALTEGALVPVGNVKSIRAWGQYLWCSWTNYDGVSTGIARLNPALFPIAPLAPAYASDLMVTGQGAVTSVETFGDKRYFCVDGLGVYGASNTGYLATTGTVDSGWIRYGTYERKAAVSLEVRHAPLAGEVVVGLVSEDETSVVAGVSDGPGSLGSDILAASNDTGEAFRMTLTLTPDATGQAGPQVRRVSLRAAPIPLRTDEINVPLIFATEEMTQAGEGQPFFFDPLAEWQYLKSLEQSRSVVQYQEGSLTTLVVVDKVEVDPRKWDRYHDSNSDTYKMWFDGEVNVRLLTLGDS